MTPDLQKLRELAERVKSSRLMFGSADSDLDRCIESLVEAVLSATEPEKPKEPRKVGGWVVVDNLGGFANLDGRGNNLTEEGAKLLAAQLAIEDPEFYPFWPCYVTGTEGIGPEDTPKAEEKREAREWFVAVDNEGTARGLFEDCTDATSVVSGWHINKPYRIIKVREVIE